MHHRQGLRWILTLVIVMAIGYVGWGLFGPGQRFKLPFFKFINAHSAMVLDEDGAPLPTQLRAGDQVDFSMLAPSARIALIKSTSLNILPKDSAYDLPIRHAGAEGVPTVITVHSIVSNHGKSPVQRLLGWGLLSFLTYPFCLSVIAFLALWKGRGSDAMGLALWATAFLLGVALQFVPSDGGIGLAMFLGSSALFLLARFGFYAMAEAMAAPLLTTRAITIWRASFFALLGLGALQSLGGPLAFIAFGWAGLILPIYGVTLTLSYVLPVVMLFAALARARSSQQLRLRLRWVAGCGAIYVVAIFLTNTPLFGPVASLLIAHGIFSLSIVGLLYAVLRTRLLDFNVVLNRTLVYAATTSLVLGLFALFESLVERLAVGERAGLLLELLVPLALGASLTTVHRRIDGLVERLIFRRQYRQETALRRFAREATFVSTPDRLMELTVTELQRHIAAPWVAFYESGPQGFTLARQAGEHALPACVDIDDPAVIALRAHEPEVDLHDRAGALQHEGYAFPLKLRGQLSGLLVIGPRPDEHYSSEERELFAYVAHEVSTALFAIRTQINEQHLAEARLREITLMEALRFGRQSLPD